MFLACGLSKKRLRFLSRFFLLLRNITTSVLVAFNEILFDLSQLDSACKSSLILTLRDSRFLSELSRQVSSANKETMLFLIEDGRSLI